MATRLKTFRFIIHALISPLPQAACVVALMMMMMMRTEAAAMIKGGGHSRTHRKSADGAAVDSVPLQLDFDALVPPKTIRPLENASISPWMYK